MKFTRAILVLSLLAVAYCETYTVITKLGNSYFKTIDGSVKLNIHGKNGKDTFRLVQTNLKSGGQYVRSIDINYPLSQINTVSAYFTLTSPMKNPGAIFKKPVIYLSEIILQDQQQIKQAVFKPANPGQPLKLKEERYLNKM